MASIKRGTLWDHGGLALALSGQALPGFWFGIMLILLLSLYLGWLPSFGGGTWQQLVMPAITLAIGYLGILTRVVRSAMLEVLGQDYIVTAHAKGLSSFVGVGSTAATNSLRTHAKCLCRSAACRCVSGPASPVDVNDRRMRTMTLRSSTLSHTGTIRSLGSGSDRTPVVSVGSHVRMTLAEVIWGSSFKVLNASAPPSSALTSSANIPHRVVAYDLLG
jgi:hypothetical protein